MSRDALGHSAFLCAGSPEQLRLLANGTKLLPKERLGTNTVTALNWTPASKDQ